MKTGIHLHHIGQDAHYKAWHTSNWSLFIYFYSDGGSLVTNTKLFPIKPGSLAFIPAGTYHYTMPDNPAVYDRTKLSVSTAVLSKLTELLEQNSLYADFLNRSLIYAEIPPEYRDEVDHIFEDIGSCFNREDKEPMFLAYLLRLIYLLNRYTTESSSNAVGFMGRAIRHINEHIATNLDIDTVCQVVGISKYYFCRQFKEQTGMTVMKYILKTRIILAKSELEKTSAPITEISDRCGFSSTSYFCRAFKQETGHSPLHYRKRTQQKI